MIGLRRIIRYGLFPAHFVGALWIAYLSQGRGWQPGAVLAGITMTTVLMVALAERVSPFIADWNRPRDDVSTDLLHAAISMVLLPKFLEISLHVFLLSVAAEIAGQGGGLWPTEQNLLVQLAVALLSTQFLEYWWHRLCHQVPWLWRLHATHHSPSRLYWLNAGRFHPLDTMVSFSLSTGSIILLGGGTDVILMLSTWVAVHGLYQHCNIDLRLGPLNYVFSMAELHRWHHSLRISEANHNYGNNMILWDLIFGTFYWPRERQPSEHVGLSDLPGFPRSYLGQLLSPFRWSQIQSRSDSESN